jgi:hypothetical protein
MTISDLSSLLYALAAAFAALAKLLRSVRRPP